MTQGMIVILENGKVKMKAVCGSDGYFVDDIPEKAILNCTTPVDLYNLMIMYDCGGPESLVVSYLDDDNKVQHYEYTENLSHEYSPWYWDQFLNPDFNPRWAKGTVQYKRIISMEDK